MASIIYDKTTNEKYLVRAKAGEWLFETRAEAQKKANEEMYNEYRSKHYACEEAGAPFCRCQKSK